MIFSYRTRQFTKRISTVLLYVLLIAVVLVFCLLLWLQRYLVYTPEGVRLDFSVSLEKKPGNLPQAPTPNRVTIAFGKENEETPDDPRPDDPTPELPPEISETRWAGYYIDPEALKADVSAVRAQLEALPAGTPVSMNLWAFKHSVLDEIRDRFPAWLDENVAANPLKCEYFLPLIPDQMIREGKAKVRLLKTGEKWYGITYAADLPDVQSAIERMKQEGKYPRQLWK